MFKGFHNPTTEVLDNVWESEDTLFVFDTNIFLNLYGYEEQTRKDFFEVLKNLGDKVWIPYHVGLEYQRRRLEVVKDEKAVFSKIDDLLEKIEKIFDNDFNEFALKRRFPKLNDNTEKLKAEVKKSLRDYKKSVDYWDKKQPCVRSHDKIRTVINDIFENKVGAKPVSQEWLDDLYREGKRRYENRIAPGYKDAVKGKALDNIFDYDNLSYQRQFGDLILWKQLIEKANDDTIKNVIFVTDDSKEDWWYILDSRGKKQIGPHASLQNEIYKESNIDIFHMCNTYQFLNDSKERLNLGIHESSIIDANSQFIQALENKRKEMEFFELHQKEELKINEILELERKKHIRHIRQKELIEFQRAEQLRKKALLELQRISEFDFFPEQKAENLYHQNGFDEFINNKLSATDEEECKRRKIFLKYIDLVSRETEASDNEM